MTILITGITGFVGEVLHNHLKREYHVYGISSSLEDRTKNIYKIDLTRIDEVNHFFQSAGCSFDTIIHLASKTANENNLKNTELLNQNVIIAKNMIMAAKDHRAAHLINISSSSVYPNITGTFTENSLPDPSYNPDCIYGLSKLNAEIIINHFKTVDMQVTHLRTAMIHGENMPDSRIIPVLQREIETHNTATLYGKGERLLNLIEVNSLARIIKRFVEVPQAGIFNVCDETISLLDLAQRLIANSGRAGTKIILKEEGNRHKFKLDTRKLNSFLNQAERC